MLGYSALFQGKADDAEQLFDESASIDVPDRTSSVNEPAQARAALRRGDQSQAFRILRSYVDDLLETDYTDLARNAAIEFINMMTAVGRLPEAERIRGYLASTGDFGSLRSPRARGRCRQQDRRQRRTSPGPVPDSQTRSRRPASTRVHARHIRRTCQRSTRCLI